MSQYQFNRPSLLGGGAPGSSGPTPRTHTTISSSYTRDPVSLNFEDDDIYSSSSSSQSPAHSQPLHPPGYNDYYYSPQPSRWSDRRPSRGPLLGGSAAAAAAAGGRLGRVGGLFRNGRRWGPRRTFVYICALFSFSLLLWVNFVPSGAERFAALRASGLGLKSPWNAWAGQQAGAQADEARWKGWEFARDSSLVYTWVNGSDPGQMALRVQYGSERQVGGARDRDNDDLRFSMRIKWIQQDTIIPAEYIPVFSSNAVEPFLHLIPNLTERFMVFNDDFMIRRRMEPWDFFTAGGGVKLFLEPGRVEVNRPVPDEKKAKQAWLHSVHHTIEILYKRYHSKWPNPRHSPRFVKHAPFVYYRRALEELHHYFGSHLANNAIHRFRNPDDVLVPFLHHGYVTQEGASCCGFSYEIVPGTVAQKNFFFVSWTDNTTANAQVLKRLEQTAPQVAAFNDNMGKGSSARAAQDQMHQHFLSVFGDYPKEFELN
ncbi:hypothetical protein OC846_002942 [Tilletia horrida]|uniref:Stealth protein CR2 conserved region 2 domain-containing protein n=1 Tax=Tilletia horrida TaxID=155126 RepID=A0AAN6GQY2_9BASI|nr:hypothetical protein OC846_002942 [Tilletia horrida]